jgi:hypothetical protein
MEWVSEVKIFSGKDSVVSETLPDSLLDVVENGFFWVDLHY